MSRRSSAPGRVQKTGTKKVAAADLNMELAKGLFNLLDRNGDGIVEEPEFELGCKDSRSFFRGASSTPAKTAELFTKLDKNGLGSIAFEDVLEEVGVLMEAMGILVGQGHEGLQLLQGRQIRAIQNTTTIGALDPGASELLVSQTEGQEPTGEVHKPPTLEEEKLRARVCSDRRAHVLHRFLSLFPQQQAGGDTAEDVKDDDRPLAIRAKEFAHRLVTGDDLQQPPPEMDVQLDVDALYTGGDSVWVSVDLSVARGSSDNGVPAQRVPVDLMIVVDVSGSMHTALPSVRKCLSKLGELVQDCDRLALMKFDDHASIVMPWQTMDDQGLATYNEAQTSLVSCGGTCFKPALEACFEELAKADSPGRSRSVLFISDGVPNESDSEILRLLSSKLHSANVSIVSAGFSQGTKADLMSAIGQCGCGPFVYIPDCTSIPQQLGRIWAAVAHTSLSSAFAVVRPLGGTRIAAVEGAFGAAELSLRPDGRQSSQQAMIVQFGGVRHGATRSVVLQLKLPSHLRGAGKIAPQYLRQSLLEVSMVSQAVSEEANPIHIQRAEFLTMQVPSLLMENLLPFPVRMVLDNDLEEFDVGVFLKQTAGVLGVSEDEIELTRLLRGSVIIDFHLKLDANRAAEVLDSVSSPQLKVHMAEAMDAAGWKLKSMSAPGQRVFRRVLQTRFADALGNVASMTQQKESEPTCIKAVQVLAASKIAQALDPQGPSSITSKIAEDCDTVLDRLKKADRESQLHFKHDLVQLQASHIAQFKCQSVAASLEVYEQPEAQQAAELMEKSAGDLSLSTAFWETVSPELLETVPHESSGDEFGVMLALHPIAGKEVDFGHLAPQVSPSFVITVETEGGPSSEKHVSLAHVVDSHSVKAVVRRSCHPSRPESFVDDYVRVPCAQALRVLVHSRSCNHDGSLTFFADSTRRKPVKVVSRALGCTSNLNRPASSTYWHFTIEGPEFWYSFRPSVDPCSQAEWGFHFEVEAVMGDSCQNGLLLQTCFVGVRPGPCQIHVRPHSHLFEIPTKDMQVRELRGSPADKRAAIEGLAAGLNAKLALGAKDAKVTNQFGLASRARLLSVNGDVLRMGMADVLYLAEEGCGTNGAERVHHNLQLAFTTDPSLLSHTTEHLLKKKLRPVAANILREVVCSLPSEVPNPQQPELVSWSWEGQFLRLTWRFGWTHGTCALHAAEVYANGSEVARVTGGFFMVSPEVRTEQSAPSLQDDANITNIMANSETRTASFALPVPRGAVLEVDLRLHPVQARSADDRVWCRLAAWLVPKAQEEELLALTSGEVGKGRKIWPGAIANLVTAAF